MGWDIRLLTSIYSGVYVAVVAYALTVWCADAKGRSLRPPSALSVWSSWPFWQRHFLASPSTLGGLFLVLWSKTKISPEGTTSTET
ncbi:unnamed protein product [Microthlaspi erraticum]|uniref:Uncharacterized protein n=1 Tax=Microthlaspi erraticum TaxID=1685480 RepID=A0A6D2HQN7_9BRAS|nr:unnamed protein product [Microthlaspi erraticum]